MTTEEEVFSNQAKYLDAKYAHFVDLNTAYLYRDSTDTFSSSELIRKRELCKRLFGEESEHGRWTVVWEWGVGFRSKEDYVMYKMGA